MPVDTKTGLLKLLILLVKHLNWCIRKALNLTPGAPHLMFHRSITVDLQVVLCLQIKGVDQILEIINKSIFWTILATIAHTIIFIPIGVIVIFLSDLAIAFSASYTYGASENIIPFNLFPSVGIPIMIFIQSVVQTFLMTAASFYSILFIFNKKKHEIYWIFIPISYSLIMTIYFYILNIDNFVKYGTIIFIIVISVICYRVVILKMINEI